ncbi:cytochrome C oxidase assembly protein [Paenibacillus darwinianus]|uniref:Cytochrome C oxidase assembly protein n=1 Tax=Paenibacillus darwinianus TaxID=1380763 RepID=A0A9W5W773_9BACL|nr:cytochrome c oxidase assembly factor CtaG [Paenibacillus darwinianus]EXX88888.1 cytochrome C oxidase assembly protein [Paenibacillus darwinianus]EXX89106.1 cytochrome C oxidase assembly protein [Paenibacillus darwinianus]EXX90437.1 cytochrome C oxidase assembly protein [Paenibacillus darwinianus]
MTDLNEFSFTEMWSPLFVLGMVTLLGGYFYLIGPWREKHMPGEARPTLLKNTYVVSAVIMFYLAQGGPLQLLGHLNFAFHMVNMSLSYLIVPPVLLLGVPAFVWRLAFRSPHWRKLGWIMHPMLTLVLFNILFSIYHMPIVFDFLMANVVLHRVYYAVLFVTSCMMWWQIVSPVPDWRRMADVRKMGYIFANGLLLTPACALIIFASAPLYAAYDPVSLTAAAGSGVSGEHNHLLDQSHAQAAFTLFNPLEDQQLGGIIMKLVQEIMYGAILTYVFTQWYRREHRADDELPPTAEPAGN